MLSKLKCSLVITSKTAILLALLAGCGGSDEPAAQPPANVAPVADAGQDLTIDEYSGVALSAVASRDNDGSISSFF